MFLPSDGSDLGSLWNILVTLPVCEHIDAPPPSWGGPPVTAWVACPSHTQYWPTAPPPRHRARGCAGASSWLRAQVCSLDPPGWTAWAVQGQRLGAQKHLPNLPLRKRSRGLSGPPSSQPPRAARIRRLEADRPPLGRWDTSDRIWFTMSTSQVVVGRLLNE